MVSRSASAGILLLLAALLVCSSTLGSPFALPSGRALPLAQAQLLQSTPAAIERHRRIGAIENWGYWLSSFAVAGVEAAPHDLLVIDSEISANRSFEREYLPHEVARMKRRSGSSPRILLAYLSFGEAERYRP